MYRISSKHIEDNITNVSWHSRFTIPASKDRWHDMNMDRHAGLKKNSRDINSISFIVNYAHKNI